MVNLDDYLAFVAIVEKGSITAAAHHLGRSLTAVSRALAALEADLGQTLVQRTTRSSNPTETGMAFLARIRPALADLTSAHEDIATSDGLVAGHITVSAAIMFGIAHVGSAALTFMDRHRDVDVTVTLSDEFVALGDGVDIAVRLGPLPDSGLMAKSLGTLRQVVFASPAYLAAEGWPREPEDLAMHQCIVRTTTRNPSAWSFERNGEIRSVLVNGRLRSGNAEICNQAALHGAGIAIAPLWQIREAIDDARVVEVLADFAIVGMPIHVVWPRQPFLPRRTRLFIDHLAAAIPMPRL